MYTYLLVLRLVHILCGAAWAGTALFLAFYVFPAVIRSGPDGPRIMQAISTTNKFPVAITVVSTLTVVSGLLLVWHLSYGFTPSWFRTPYGASLGIGGLLALVAYIQALFINRPGVNRVQAIGIVVAQRGTSPNEGERAELSRLRDKLYLSTRLIALWLTISVAAMAVARYL